MKKNKKDFKYSCIIEVSQFKDFPKNKHAKEKTTQVCIGKLHDRYMCISSIPELNAWILNQVKLSVNSRSIYGQTIEFWNYGRKIKKSK